MPSYLSAVLRPRKHAKHAKQSRAVPALAAGGLTLTLAATDAALLSGGASAAAPDSAWDRLAVCESGGNWSINTGNGYYGGLQFNLGTWRGVGMSGYPHQASRAQQIAAANRLHDARGFAPWPACSRSFGLRGNGGAVAAPAPAPKAAAPVPAPAPVAAPAPKAASAPAPPAAPVPPVPPAPPVPAQAVPAPDALALPTPVPNLNQEPDAPAPAPTAAAPAAPAAPPAAAPIVAAATPVAPLQAPVRASRNRAAAPALTFSGRAMTTADRRSYRADVRDWQQQMRNRGWRISVDGLFGPQSAAVAARFVAQKGLPTARGTVDAAAFTAAWTLPTR